MNDMEWQAIKESNKLGRRGQRVVGVIPPRTATDPQRYILITTQEEPRPASEPNWWEE